jgi:hypothetical protein
VTSLKGVISSLNSNYRGVSDEQANARLGGGWGKKLWVRPPRDIDLIYLLPNEVYHRFHARVGNRQSALLQEVKGVLGVTYPQTDMRGDGQVVIVPFDHVTIEVAPAFVATNGCLLICDTNNGGSYRESDLAAEIAALDYADAWYNGCARPLIRMLKQWQRYCSVPIRSFEIEQLVIDFLPHAHRMFVANRWWDWLLRDFFEYTRTRADSFIAMPGTGQLVFVGDAWLSRAESAHLRAIRACGFEAENEDLSAGTTWQMVFGTMIPASAA